MLRVHALIPAAGQSVRFGGTTLKQYAHLLGKPVMAHSIDNLAWHPEVSAVTVVLAPDDGIYDELIRPHYAAVRTVPGGSSRAESVLKGLRYIRQQDPDCEWVLVHDAARPCLARESLESLMRLAAESTDGAILAVPVADTLKQAGNSLTIDKTIDRANLWTAQTPQMFRLDDLLRNLEAAIIFGPPPTDEAEAMERAGMHPVLVPGSVQNIKITGPGDLVIAEFILRQRQD